MPISPLAANINKRKRQKTFYKIMAFLFQIMCILFGLDFGFLKLKSVYSKFAFKLLPVIVSVIIAVATANEINSNEGFLKTVWFGLNFLMYFTSVIFLSLPRETLCNFFWEFQEIDSKLKVNNSKYNLELKFLLALFVSFIYKVIFTLGLCVFTEQCLKPYWVSFVFFWVVMCMKTCNFCYTFIYYAANCRLKQLNLALSKAESNFAFYQHIYKSLVDITEKYKAAYDPIYSVTLMITMLEVLIAWYSPVKAFQELNYQINLVGFCIEIAVFGDNLLTTIIPGIFGGMMTAQVEKLKVLLHNKRLLTQDQDQINDIIRFIHYVEARGCRFRVWRVIPLSADLIGMVLGFFITYLIVIIQFTRSC